MIFLAVTMGFFAESVRESISDREKEKEFMKSLVQDLLAEKGNTKKALKYFRACMWGTGW